MSQEPPPQDNDHVAPGCSLFPSSPPTLDAETEAQTTALKAEFCGDRRDEYIAVIDRTVAIMDRRVRELREMLGKSKQWILDGAPANATVLIDEVLFK